MLNEMNEYSISHQYNIKKIEMKNKNHCIKESNEIKANIFFYINMIKAREAHLTVSFHCRGISNQYLIYITTVIIIFKRELI